MSDPFLKYKDAGWGAACEIVSGLSALNSTPSPIEPPEDNNGWISELDGMVQHAMTHFDAAIQLASKAQQENNALKMRVRKLELELKSWEEDAECRRLDNSQFGVGA